MGPEMKMVLLFAAAYIAGRVILGFIPSLGTIL